MLANDGVLAALQQSAKPAGVSVVELTPDDADVRTLARYAKYADATGAEAGERWLDAGYWLTPLVCALLLPLFRRGWLLPTPSRA